MSKELQAFSDGTFVFVEDENGKQFYFYRKDGEVLGDVGRRPMDFYQHYMVTKMMNGEITGMVANNLKFEESADGKCIRITLVDEFGESASEKAEEAKALEEPKKTQIQTPEESIQNHPKTNFVKRMLKKIFG